MGLVARKFGYFFKREDDGIQPKMYMRKPVDGGDGAASSLKASTVMGRGRDRYIRSTGASSRRAVVKTKVIQGGAKAIDHARYLEKDGAGLDGDEVRAFTATKDNVDMAEVTKEWSEDRHYFQQIISPKDGERLDMQKYVRDVVGRYEQDLGTELSWVSVIHYDTEHPHAHVMIRGRDDRGGDLVIDREYIRHGMRTRAMEIATMELGPRSAHEIAADIEHRQKQLESGIGEDLGKAAGWQLHLNVPAERWDRTTQAVMSDLSERGLSYHMQFADSGIKTLTVSVGSYDDAVAVAQDLDSKFGSRIPDQTGKMMRDDVRLSGHVWGSFNPQGDREFTRWTVKGVPLEKDAARDLRGLEGAERKAMSEHLRESADAKLMEKYAEFYAGSERVQALEKLRELQRNMGHGY